MFLRKPTFAVLAASMMGAFVTFFPGSARAVVLTDCGNLDLSGSESCTLVTSGGCQAQCTPLNVEASCSAQLETTCSGGCTASVQASCSTSCEASCSDSCTVDSGSFSCEGDCSANCGATCETQCESSDNQTQCTSECQASCSGRCNASCSGTPPTATCSAQCQADCQGSCTAQANMSCDINCQTTGYADCQTQVTGGCNTQCEQPQGALFCNGQYVNAPDLASCLSQLSSALNINVSADAACSGGTCTGAATASCGQIAPGAMPPATESVLGLGLGLGIVGAVRRRTRKKK